MVPRLDPARNPRIELRVPATRQEWSEAAQIVREYGQSLGIDLGFQDFENELAQLPERYTAPLGVLLLAWVDGEVAGCCGLRPLPDVDYPNACEMKRLYVRRAFRRFGLGRQLTEAILDHGLRAGFSCMLLDTLDDMEAARDLYESLGFQPIPPFYFNPVAGAHYLKVDLQ